MLSNNIVKKEYIPNLTLYNTYDTVTQELNRAEMNVKVSTINIEKENAVKNCLMIAVVFLSISVILGIVATDQLRNENRSLRSEKLVLGIENMRVRTENEKLKKQPLAQLTTQEQVEEAIIRIADAAEKSKEMRVRLTSGNLNAVAASLIEGEAAVVELSKTIEPFTRNQLEKIRAKKRERTQGKT